VEMVGKVREVFADERIRGVLVHDNALYKSTFYLLTSTMQMTQHYFSRMWDFV